jgi:hypothetical protein
MHYSLIAHILARNKGNKGKNTGGGGDGKRQKTNDGGKQAGSGSSSSGSGNQSGGGAKKAGSGNGRGNGSSGAGGAGGGDNGNGGGGKNNGQVVKAGNKRKTSESAESFFEELKLKYEAKGVNQQLQRMNDKKYANDITPPQRLVYALVNRNRVLGDWSDVYLIKICARCRRPTERFRGKDCFLCRDCHKKNPSPVNVGLPDDYFFPQQSVNCDTEFPGEGDASTRCGVKFVEEMGIQSNVDEKDRRQFQFILLAKKRPHTVKKTNDKTPDEDYGLCIMKSEGMEIICDSSDIYYFIFISKPNLILISSFSNLVSGSYTIL